MIIGRGMFLPLSLPIFREPSKEPSASMTSPSPPEMVASNNQDPIYLLPSGGSTISLDQSCDVEEPFVHVDNPT